jgi:hypothetical protein
LVSFLVIGSLKFTLLLIIISRRKARKRNR